MRQGHVSLAVLKGKPWPTLLNVVYVVACWAVKGQNSVRPKQGVIPVDAMRTESSFGSTFARLRYCQPNGRLPHTAPN